MEFCGKTGDNLNKLIFIIFRRVFYSCHGVGVVVRYGTGKRCSSIASRDRAMRRVS